MTMKNVGASSDHHTDLPTKTLFIVTDCYRLIHYNSNFPTKRHVDEQNGGGVLTPFIRDDPNRRPRSFDQKPNTTVLHYFRLDSNPFIIVVV